MRPLGDNPKRMDVNMVSRLPLLSVAIVGALLAACHKSHDDVNFDRFEGHHLVISKGRIAIDSETDNPFYFVFVDNASPIAADGSYEHPYPTLALAEANSGPYDVIYVFPGDGTASGMNVGVSLQAHQKFWGASTSHLVQTSKGSVTIPVIASSLPRITNTTGNGITLATDNEVSGFILPSAVDNGIYGLNPKNIKISSCTIDGSQSDQIHLEYNASSGSINLDGLTLVNGNGRAIFIDSTMASSPMDFKLSNTVIQGTAAQALDASFTNAVNAQLTNNIVEGNTSSSNLTFGGVATLLVSGNRFNNNTSISEAPLIVSASAGALSAVINSNTIDGNTSGGMRFILNNTVATLSITSNTISNNGTGSIATLGAAILINPNNTSAGRCNLVLSNNTISGNTGAALLGTNGAFDDFQVTASDNSVTGNGGGGLMFANAANTFALTASNNIISGGGDHGISTAGGLAMTTAHIALSGNRITANTNSANGVALSHDGANLYFIATNNDMSQNAASGIVMYSSGSMGNVVASIKNNTVDNNQNAASNSSGGIDLEQFTNLSLNLDGNTLSNNGGSDVFIGSTDTSPVVCSVMSGNNSNMGYVFSSGSGIFNLAPMDVTSVNSGTIITIGTITSVASCP